MTWNMSDMDTTVIVKINKSLLLRQIKNRQRWKLSLAALKHQDLEPRVSSDSWIFFFNEVRLHHISVQCSRRLPEHIMFTVDRILESTVRHLQCTQTAASSVCAEEKQSLRVLFHDGFFCKMTLLVGDMSTIRGFTVNSVHSTNKSYCSTKRAS